MKLSWFAFIFMIFIAASSYADTEVVIVTDCQYSSVTASSVCQNQAQPQGTAQSDLFNSVMGRARDPRNRTQRANVFQNPYVNTTSTGATTASSATDTNSQSAQSQLFYSVMSRGGSTAPTTQVQTQTQTYQSADPQGSMREKFFEVMSRGASSAPTTQTQTLNQTQAPAQTSDSNSNGGPPHPNFYDVMGVKRNFPSTGGGTGTTPAAPAQQAPAQKALMQPDSTHPGSTQTTSVGIITSVPINQPTANAFDSSLTPTSGPAVTSPVTDHQVTFRPLDGDSEQWHPVTPILPTQTIDDKLESYCPDCARAKDKEYQEKFAGFKDIQNQLAGNMLKNAAHNMMKIVHMSCDADKVFVPTNYVTDLEYFNGHAENESRLKGKLTDMVPQVQLDRYQNDQLNGDIYRTPLASDVARIRVSDSKTDSRTCADLHDKPQIFYVRGHSTYSQNSVDPFNANSARALTDGKANISDCASTIDAVFAASGLKFSPKDTTYASAYNKSTSALVTLASDKGSCVSTPSFSGDDSIHTGDIFVLHRSMNGSRADSGHVLMFDDVKEDPFNLADITRPQDCVGKDSKIRPSQFRFSIMQSSGTTVDRQVFERFKGIDLTVEQHYDDLGPSVICDDASQPRGCDMRARFEDWGAHVLRMAQQACLAKTTGKAERPTEKILDRDTTPGKEGSSNGILIRHKGPTPNCTFAKIPEIVGAKCVAGCLNK